MAAEPSPASPPQSPARRPPRSKSTPRLALRSAPGRVLPSAPHRVHSRQDSTLCRRPFPNLLSLAQDPAPESPPASALALPPRASVFEQLPLSPSLSRI